MVISAQLSLFDTAAVIKPTYKIGDRVKVRRKTPHAPLLKKGDIVRIEAIHPHNGSCKFWNELTESWGYLYPDEFVLLPPTENDSITPVESAVIESTLPPAENNSITSVESAVIESTLPPAENDSITLDPISSYKAGGTARGGQYYRLSYRVGERVKHCHIRGGNTDSPIAQAKVKEVRSLLAAGVSPAEIAAMLQNSRGGTTETPLSG